MDHGDKSLPVDQWDWAASYRLSMAHWTELEVLKPVRLKYERALTLYEEFFKVRNQFLDLRPYDVRIEPDHDTKLITVSAVVKHDVPENLGPIAGDFLHNIRSGFNVLGWLLAGHEAGKHTEFPIYLNRDDFYKRTKKGSWDRTSGFAKMRGFDPKAIEIVKDMQPFNNEDPEHQGLWLIHKAAIVDRHESTTLVAGVSKRAEIHLQHAAKIELLEKVNLDRALAVGEHVIATYKVEVIPGRTAMVKMRGNFQFEIAFDLGGPARGHLVPDLLENGLQELDVATRELAPYVK